MNIFITGTTGYIGQQLALKLADEGHQIHALVRSPEKSQLIQHKNISIYKGDLLDASSIEKAMQNCELVYHIAAYAKINLDPDIYYQMNVLGTDNVFRIAQTIGVKKVVYTSTAGVIGPSDHEPCKEYDIRTIPFFNDYETSKFISEEMALRYTRRGLDIVTVNPTRVYGPGFDSVSNAVTRYVRLYIRGLGRFLPGSGKKLGNYAFINDVVIGHQLAMEKGIPGERYILGGENVTYKYLFDLVGEIHGKRIWQVSIPAKLLIALVAIFSGVSRTLGFKPPLTPAWTKKYLYNWALSSEKAEKELGYVITPLKTGLQQTIEWIKKEINNDKQ